MSNRIVIRSVLLFLATVALAIPLENSAEQIKIQNNRKRAISTNAVRTNAIIKTPIVVQKPGFFRTLFSALFEQWVDTGNTWRNVSTLLETSFLPENAPPTPSAPPALAINATAPPFKLKRSEMIALIRKNLLGIARLVDIEVKQALVQSDRTWPEYQRNISKEVSKWL